MADADPAGTPLPRPVSDRHGRARDGGYSDAEGPAIHECLHPELIDDVRQSRKRRWPVILAVVALAGGSIGTLSTCVYTQGQAAGSTSVRVEAIEARAAEDRSAAARDRERQRQDATDAAQRHTELLQALHALDSRMGRIEERLAPRR